MFSLIRYLETHKGACISAVRGDLTVYMVVLLPGDRLMRAGELCRLSSKR